MKKIYLFILVCLAFIFLTIIYANLNRDSSPINKNLNNQTSINQIRDSSSTTDKNENKRDSSLTYLTHIISIFKSLAGDSSPTTSTYTLKSQNSYVSNSIKDLKSDKMWPFEIGYSEKDKIIAYNDSYLLAIKGKKIYSTLNLKKIDANHINGPIITTFKFSPDGNYVIINNGDSQNSSKSIFNLYFFDVKKNKLNILSKTNKFNIIDCWSNLSKYYAYYEKSGETVHIYDVTAEKLKKINIGKLNVQKLYISDKGNLLINADKNYIFKKNKDYAREDIKISGAIIDYNNNDIYYYDEENIYKNNSGKITKLVEMEKKYKLKEANHRYSVFSDGDSTVVYDYKKIFHFGFGYVESFKDGRSFFSPDIKKCLISKIQYPMVISYTGQVKEYKDKKELGGIYRYPWINSNTIVIIRNHEEKVLIIKFNVKNGNEEIISF